MKLYLVQHGEAAPKEVNPERPLTKKGRRDVSRMAKHLKKRGVRVIATWHSEKLRAIQTAQILGEAVSIEVVKQEGLAPEDPADKWLEELGSRVRDVMIVSHLPFLGRLVSLLLAGQKSSPSISFKPGKVVCLERKVGLRPRGGSAPAGKWSLVWMAFPESV